MTTPDVAAIEARLRAATKGPWEWRGNVDSHSLRLVTWNHLHEGRRVGQVTVMDFARAGMQSAEPCFRDDSLMMQRGRDLVRYEVCHDAKQRSDRRVYRGDIDGINHPDAELIANAPADIAALLAEVKQLRAKVSGLKHALAAAEAAIRAVDVEGETDAR